MIALENVSKTYGERVALHPASLEFHTGKTTVLIGPSGCGKSTVLRMIVGLVRPDTGGLLLDGERLATGNLARVRHSIGYVIQDGGLFPHLTALENVTLLARHLGRNAAEIAARVHELCTLTGIAENLLSSYPQQLSGGQRQRVGLMRALMLDPPFLLLDEPLGALDPVTRYQLQGELKSIFARLSRTVVMVTHDMAEAAFLADDIVLMREGRIVQRGKLKDLRERPAAPYVREFMRAQRAPGEAQAL